MSSDVNGLHMYLEDWPRAIDYMERAERLLHQPGMAEGPASVLGIYANLAGAYVGGKRPADAHRWFEKALAFAKDKGVPAPGVLNNQGTLFREEGRHHEALASFELARVQFEQISQPENVGVIEKNIGETWIQLGDRVRAAEHLARAESIYLEKDIKPKRLELYPVMIENYEALGRPADALKALHAFKSLSDEVNSVESKARVAQLESDIDLERKGRELAVSEQKRALQEAENQLLRSQRARDRLITGGMLAGLVGLIIILALLARDRRFKARAHQELELRNARIEMQHHDLEVLNETLRRQSREDSLTGLNNRFFLKEFLDAASAPIDIAGKRPAQSMLLIMVDLDHFKRINDEHGHLTGDRVLVAVADLLRATRRDQDVLVRWGGEEFIWLCLDADVQLAATLSARLRERFRELRVIGDDGEIISLTASLGFVPIPTWPGIETDWELALRIADNAVYRSKAKGRDRWTGYVGNTPPTADADNDALQVTALEGAGHLQRMEMA